jgi:hypothetical protein
MLPYAVNPDFGVLVASSLVASALQCAARGHRQVAMRRAKDACDKLQYAKSSDLDMIGKWLSHDGGRDCCYDT